MFQSPLLTFERGVGIYQPLDPTALVAVAVVILVCDPSRLSRASDSGYTCRSAGSDARRLLMDLILGGELTLQEV